MVQHWVFAVNDLPYDLTDLEMTSLSWRPGATSGSWIRDHVLNSLWSRG